MASSSSTLSMSLRRRRTHAPKPTPLPIFSSLDDGDGDDDDDDVSCQRCGSGESPAELLLCDKCDLGFHIFCLRPILPSVPTGSWFCSSCCDKNNKKPKSFPLVQTKIIDFFRIKRSSEEPLISSQVARKKPKRGSSLVVSKKKRKLLPFSPSVDPKRRLQLMASLATALMATNTKFSNELTYMPGMAPRSANCPALEHGGMQVLSKEDTETLNLCKTMMERGECAPLMVVFDPLEGFTVEADRCIKDLTIITEYAGDVDFLKNRENDDGDSMMTLLSASDPSKTLVICPDKRSHIARFINGINNHTLQNGRHLDVKTISEIQE